MLKLIVCVLVIGLTASFAQADLQWDGGGTDNLWTTTDNWEFDVLPISTDMIAIDNPIVPQPLFTDGMVVSVDRVMVGEYSGPCTLDVTGGSLTSSGKPLILGTQAGSEGTLNISGGNVLAAHGLLMTVYQSTATINMSGGTLTVQPLMPVDWRDHLVVGHHGDATLNMSGGAITVADDIDMVIAKSNDGSGTVNMTAGTINVARDIRMSTFEGATGGISEFYLNGGEVTAANLLMTANASLDLMEGVMILDGDDTVAVQGYIDSGLITGYGGNGTVVVSYDVGFDETTVTAIPEPATMVLLALGGLLSLRRRRTIH